MAQEAPSALKAGSPSRDDSSLTKTRATPSSAASAGSSVSGVGAYSGRLWWKRTVSSESVGQRQRLASGRTYQSALTSSSCVTVAWLLKILEESAPRRLIKPPSDVQSLSVQPIILDELSNLRW